jgi:hypothetical protein
MTKYAARNDARALLGRAWPALTVWNIRGQISNRQAAPATDVAVHRVAWQVPEKAHVEPGHLDPVDVAAVEVEDPAEIAALTVGVQGSPARAEGIAGAHLGHPAFKVVSHDGFFRSV